MISLALRYLSHSHSIIGPINLSLIIHFLLKVSDCDFSCLHLKALSSESFERLPVFNKSAWRHYKTSPEADDWSNPSKEPRDASKSKYKANR